MRGLHVRLYTPDRRVITTVDGVCAGLERDSVVLAPSSQGERIDVALDRVYAVTQLPGEFPDEHSGITPS
jgi:hypothetical protein